MKPDKRNGEIPETLLSQVKNAVELLVRRLAPDNTDSAAALYDAVLGVMMRLGFVFCAENRGLFPLDDPICERKHTASTLRDELQLTADRDGEEALERRFDAWPRVLSLLKTLYDGPDPAGSFLPICNRTVLCLLNAFDKEGGESSFTHRTLDVEQIGRLYEGMQDYTLMRADRTMIGFIGGHSAGNPNISLSELEKATLEGENALLALIRKRTKLSETAIRKSLAKPISARFAAGTGTFESIKPYINLFRPDVWGCPVIYREGEYMLTPGPGRRESGTHYTPESLCEEVVKTVLPHLVYEGFSGGEKPDDRRLKKPHVILSLKICDPAMGSGAFLIQACRRLGAFLADSWEIEEKKGLSIDIHGNAVETSAGLEKMPPEPAERLNEAMRLVAERCLYGVELNPLAVEIAKLSIRLITASKGRSFVNLEHNFRNGDSLLGLPHSGKAGLFDMKLPGEQTAKRKLADAMTAAVFSARRNREEIENNLNNLTGLAVPADDIDSQAARGLAIDLPPGKSERIPFHWEIEFPEVFAGKNGQEGGFDAFIGNPPFMGGRKMRSVLGEAYLQWLLFLWPHVSLNSDLCAFFFLRAAMLLRKNGSVCFLATKTIGQGDTARTGLQFLTGKKNFCIRYARSSFPWPGKATVMTSLVALHKGKWDGKRILDGREVQEITAILDDGDHWGNAKVIGENVKINFQGSVFAGKGFVLTEKEREYFLNVREDNGKVIFPFLGGNDLNTSPEFKASRWAVDFRDHPLERCENEWPEILERIRRLVKPERDLANRETHRKYWWHHGDKRPALYERIRKNEHVFVLVRHTKHLALARVSTKQVFQESLCILDLPNWTAFAAIQSNIHYIWARRGSSTLGTGLRYTPSDYFDTFPFLHLNSPELEKLGEEYYNHRTKIMLESKRGLTGIYNSFHSPEKNGEGIAELRELHRRMDEAVATAYGWSDLVLGHDFRRLDHLPENDRIRFTISEKARREVPRRLTELRAFPELL